MSQTKQPQYSLLLGPFVRKNQEKYANNAKVLAKFDGLTLDDLQITNVQKSADGVRTAQINSTTKGFTGPGQQWKSVTVHDSKVLTAVSETALADEAEVAQQTAPGVYIYGTGADAKFAIVVASDTAADQQASVAVGLLTDALNYDVPAADITADAGLITVDAETIYGQVEYVVAQPATTELEPDSEPTDLNATN